MGAFVHAQSDPLDQAEIALLAITQKNANQLVLGVMKNLLGKLF